MRFYGLCIRFFILIVFFLIINNLIIFFLNKKQIVKNESIESYKIKKTGEHIKQHNVTIVSTYFKLKKSKYDHYRYKKWIRNFFMSVTSAPLVIFTDKDSIDQELLDLRRDKPTTFYYVSSHWDILSEIEYKRNKTYTFNYKFIQTKLDPEKNSHSSDLYVLWNIKSFITNKIAQENPYNSSIFIYTDSGSFRERSLLNWPNQSIVLNLMKSIENRILFGQVIDVNEENLTKTNFPLFDLIQGTFFLGSNLAIRNFEKNFWNIHDLRFNQGLFIGKDQTMMNLIAFKSNPNSVYLFKTLDLKRSCDKGKLIFDKWFIYQYYLYSYPLCTFFK